MKYGVTGAKTLPRKCPDKMYFHIVTSEFYMPRQKMLKLEGCGFCFSCIFICKFQSLCNLQVTLLSLFGLKCSDFFSIWVLFHEHSWFTGQQWKGEAISLTLLYHFCLLHRHQPGHYWRELPSAGRLEVPRASR